MYKDQQLIAESLNGQNAAFEELVHRYQDRLYNAVIRLVDHEEDATDIVQDTFLNAFSALKTFRGECEWYTWLYRIAVNSAISLKRKKLAALSLGIGTTEISRVDPPDESRASNPGHQIELAEIEVRLQRALNHLIEEFRIVLVLKEIEGLSYEEMAEILNVPIGTIRSRLHRARIKLRNFLLKEEMAEDAKKTVCQKTE